MTKTTESMMAVAHKEMERERETLIDVESESGKEIEHVDSGLPPHVDLSGDTGNGNEVVLAHVEMEMQSTTPMYLVDAVEEHEADVDMMGEGGGLETSGGGGSQ